MTVAKPQGYPGRDLYPFIFSLSHATGHAECSALDMGPMVKFSGDQKATLPVETT